MRNINHICWLVALFATLAVSTAGAVDRWGLAEGTVELQSAGSLAFGPDGILIIGDAKAATIYAVDTGTEAGSPAKVNVNVEDLQAKIATALNVDAKSVTVNDLAVNPERGDIYLSVAVGENEAALIHVSTTGDVGRVALKSVNFAKISLPNAPADKITGEGRRRGNRRLESITDLAYTDNKVLVAGLSGEEGGSTVREIGFPFVESDPGVNLEIYHAAHGRVENYAPIRTFVPFNIGGEPSLLAGFTCTPLVKFPIKDLTSGKKIEGTTVAELGNRNRPLDMIVYEKDGQHFLLTANSARGVMKISTEGLDKNDGLTEPVKGGGTAGQKYETIDSLQNVVQLDKLNATHAVIVTAGENGTLRLATVELP